MKNKKVVAVVLCGGMGSRLSEITKKKPKSLADVLGKPIIWYVVSNLLKNNIEDIIFPLGYKGDLIENFIKKKFKKNLNYFKFIKTGKKTEINNRIKKISFQIKNYDNFMILNSDTVFDFDLKSLINQHVKNKNLVTLSGIKMFSSWGSIIVNKNNNFEKFVVNSKIENYQIKNYGNLNAFRNTGITVISTKCLNFINQIYNKNFEISLYNKYKKIRKVGFKLFKDFWFPIETLKDLNDTKHNIKNKKNIISLQKKLNNFYDTRNR